MISSSVESKALSPSTANASQTGDEVGGEPRTAGDATAIATGAAMGGGVAANGLATGLAAGGLAAGATIGIACVSGVGSMMISDTEGNDPLSSNECPSAMLCEASLQGFNQHEKTRSALVNGFKEMHCTRFAQIWIHLRTRFYCVHWEHQRTLQRVNYLETAKVFEDYCLVQAYACSISQRLPRSDAMSSSLC
jgi:hypothetical protein